MHRACYNLKIRLMILLHSSRICSGISPSSPSIKSLDTVATLSNLMTAGTLRPVNGNTGSQSDRNRSLGRTSGWTFDDTNATIASSALSWITSAGRSLELLGSVNGKWTRTIFPFIGIGSPVPDLQVSHRIEIGLVIKESGKGIF